MCHYKTLTGPPKHFPKKINKLPCTIFYTAKMTNSPKGTTFDITNLNPGELIHMDLDLYNVTSIRGFNSILTVVCANKIMHWVFYTSSKRAPVHIIKHATC